MEAERVYKGKVSRIIQQKHGGEGVLEMVDNRPGRILQMVVAKSLQRIKLDDGKDILQGKFNQPIQREEEEELLQGKFEAAVQKKDKTGMLVNDNIYLEQEGDMIGGKVLLRKCKFAQLEMSRKNESKPIANPFVQKKNNSIQDFKFVYNRSGTIAQRKIDQMANSSIKTIQFAMGIEENGTWKTYSSFDNNKEIDSDHWVATCYLSNHTPAHRMLALEGYSEMRGWECFAHLTVPEMANGSCNKTKMGLNILGMYPMKCGPEWRLQSDLSRLKSCQHNSIIINRTDGDNLKNKMESECIKGNKYYDYKTTGGDMSTSFNCKTWVEMMKNGLAI